MKSTNQAELKKVFNWINNQLNGMNYGEVGINLIIHDGGILRVEKTITEKDRQLSQRGKE